MTLRSDAERYIAFKRGQGYKMQTEERLLGHYVTYAEAHGDLFVATGRMVVARQMEWTPPALMFDVRGIEWTLAGRRHHSAQVGSIRFPGKPEGPNED